MATNKEKLASQIRDIYTGGNPSAQARVTLGQIELLIDQVVPAIRLQNFYEMYREFGATNLNGQFWKYYDITLTTGGDNWKKCELPKQYLSLPTNRGFSVFDPETNRIIETWPLEEFIGLAGGLMQSTGRYFACPVNGYLEIRGDCSDRLPKIKRVRVGMVVPDETCLDEAIDLVVIERILNILKVQPFPDKTINANPQ